MTKKILVSGMQPTGRPHVGNYFGAMKQFVDMQDDYAAHIFVANYHALTTMQDGAALSENTLDVVFDYLAIGIDPEKTLLFVQSDVPQVTELTWMFNTLVTVPFMERAHSYKDKVANGIEPTMGLFDYPVLMAADILLPQADVVPVGQDQQQHVEYARDIAQKFNNAYGDTFKLPESRILPDVAVVPGTDGRKMSKSYGNTIPLFATDEEIEKAVMSIPTDSKGVDEPKDPAADNVYKLHVFFAGDELPKIREGYEKGGLSYSESKKMLIEELKAFIAPLRERRAEIAKDETNIRAMLAANGAIMRERAEAVMTEVRKKVGLVF